MKRYRATLTAEFVIEAENIAQARLNAKSIRAIGERYGARYDRHGNGTRHRIERVLERVHVVREPESGGTTP